MFHLKTNESLSLRFGEIHTTTAPDWSVEYSEPVTKQARDEITQVDSYESAYGSKATAITTAETILTGPVVAISDANNGSGANSRRYKCRVFIANLDTIAHTCFLSRLVGSTHKYILSGVSIPAGGTLTIDEAGAVSITGSPITSITAGSGLTGGGSSGAVTIDANVDGTSILITGDTITRGVLSGDVTASAGLTATVIASDVVTDSKLRNSNGLSVIGRSANSTGDPADIVAANDHEVLRRSGTSVGFGQVNLAQSAAVTGTLDETNGGTGQSTITSGDLLYGSAANTLSKLAIGGAGKFLGSVSSLPAWGYPTQVLTKTDVNYTIAQADYGALVLMNPTTSRTATLPAPATVGQGWWCMVKKMNASTSVTVSVARNGSETIDGRSVSDVLTAQYAYAIYMTDGTNWFVMGVSDQIIATSAGLTVNVTSITSTQYGNICSATIQPGTWLLSGGVFLNIGTTTISGSCAMALSANSNNTQTDHVVGDNVLAVPFNTTGTNGSSTVSDWTATVATAATYYCKAVATHGAAGTGTWGGRMTAQRIR